MFSSSEDGKVSCRSRAASCCRSCSKECLGGSSKLISEAGVSRRPTWRGQRHAIRSRDTAISSSSRHAPLQMLACWSPRWMRSRVSVSLAPSISGSAFGQCTCRAGMQHTCKGSSSHPQLYDGEAEPIGRRGQEDGTWYRRNARPCGLVPRVAAITPSSQRDHRLRLRLRGCRCRFSAGTAIGRGQVGGVQCSSRSHRQGSIIRALSPSRAGLLPLRLVTTSRILESSIAVRLLEFAVPFCFLLICW